MSAVDGGPIPSREVAHRLFAAEYDDADLEHSDSAEERAPNYVVTPTGARVNRLFVVGVLTAVEPVSDDVLRARVVDPTGAFVVYAGQYQPEAVAFLEAADVPSFVAVTGKARTFQPDGADRVFTSIRPESMTEVDAATRDRWTVQAAEHTLARIATIAAALDRAERGDELVAALESAGVEPGLAAGTRLAIDHYGTSPAYLATLRELAIAAVAVVTGDREEVPDRSLDPSADGSVDATLSAAPPVAGTITAGGSAPDPAGASRPDSPTSIDTPDAEPASPASDEEPGGEAEDAMPSGAPAEPAEELGDFDTDGAEGPSDQGLPEEPYELDEAEREAVEAEFGTEFSTGSEVDEPGEAGLETETAPPDTAAQGHDDAEPDPDASPSTPDESSAGGSAATELSSDDDRVDGAGGADEGDDAAADEGSVDLEDAAVAAMTELDEGDGAEHDAVVEAVVESHGADSEAVEAAIEDALMNGLCYEPSDGRLKAI